LGFNILLELGQIPQLGVGQLAATQPFLGTPFTGTNAIWKPAFTQQFGPIAPQVPLYQPVHPIGKYTPQTLVQQLIQQLVHSAPQTHVQTHVSQPIPSSP